MRQQGRLAEWNDDRGFGFITPAAGGPRVFVHVSAFPRGRRPASDVLVSYTQGRDERNRPRASDVRYLEPTRAGRRSRRGLAAALGTAAAFLLLLLVLVLRDQASPVVLAPYLLLSTVSVALYRADKSAAERRAWRVPEANLHLVALLGGWPGALVAQRAFRHKTTKQPFRTIFWGTVLVNCLALAWIVSGGAAGILSGP